MTENELSAKAVTLNSQARKIETGLRTAISLYEVGDVDSSVTVVGRNIERTTELLAELRTLNEPTRLYIEVILTNKLPHFVEHQSYFLHLDQKHKTGQVLSNLGDYGVALIEFEKEIHLLTKEIQRILPYQNPFFAFLKSLFHSKKRWLYVWLPLVLVAVGCVLWRDLQLVRHSLVGEYYLDQDFKDLYKKRNDPEIDFNWGEGSPFASGFKNDNFSVRWTGYLITSNKGAYEFQTESDDGVRVWLDDHLVIDDWTTHPVKKNRAIVLLKPGHYSIKVEYFEYSGEAEMRLLWRLPSHYSFEVIPSANFRSSDKFLN